MCSSEAAPRISRARAAPGRGEKRPPAGHEPGAGPAWKPTGPPAVRSIRRSGSVQLGRATGLLAGLILAGCGLKGPPRPPLPAAPDPVRDVRLRQSGPNIELNWLPPVRRQNGKPLDGPVTYEVRMRPMDRPAAPAGSIPAPRSTAPGGVQTSGSTPVLLSAEPNVPGGQPGNSVNPSFTAEMEKRREYDFLRNASVVATVPGPAAVAAAGGAGGPEEMSHGRPLRADRVSVSLAPDAFAGTRLAGARLVFAVLAVDARGRRSPPRPVLEIDPVEPLPPPPAFSATPLQDGIHLSWTLPKLPAGSPPVLVNVYRGAPEDVVEGALMPGSPFAGEGALDISARIGESYAYKARLVAVGTNEGAGAAGAGGAGGGLRESLPAAIARVDYLDLFPPGPPGLVTIDTAPVPADHPVSWAARLAWSAPVDADVAGFRIYRGEGGGKGSGTSAFTLAGTVPATEGTWLDTAVIAGRHYLYRVTAFDTASPPNESAPSEVVETTIPKNPPPVPVQAPSAGSSP